MGQGDSAANPVYTSGGTGPVDAFGSDVDVTRLPSLPAGTNSIGNIGTVTPGTAATNLGKAEDAVHASGDVGVMALGVASANTAALTSFGAIGDYAPPAVDINGVAFVQTRPYSRTRTLADVQVKGSAGFVHNILIASNQATPVAGLLTIYDSLTETGTVLYSEWVAAGVLPHTVNLDVLAGTGIYVGFDATLTGIQVVVTYL